MPDSTPPGVPRWVKVSAIAVLVVVALLAISLLAGVKHGPGRHGGSGGDATAHAGTHGP